MTDPIPWISAVLRGECPPWPFGREAADVERPMQCAQEQGVIELLLSGLSRCARAADVPDELLRGLTQRDRMDRAVELNREIEVTRVVALLAAADLHPLIMKGTALAYGLYPHPHWRSRCDTDLLFADRTSADRAWGLLASGGYQRANAVRGDWINREFACHRTDRVGVSHTLDIHWCLINTQIFSTRLSYAELDRDARPIPALGPEARGLSPIHALLLACMHRLTHAREGRSHRLIWLYDIHLLTSTFTDAHWARCAELATARGIAGIVLDGLNAARTQFAGAVPRPVLEGLAAASASEWRKPGCLDNARIAFLSELRALPDWRSRGRLMREHLFPDAHYILKRYDTKRTWRLPILYLYRVINGLMKTLK